MESFVDGLPTWVVATAAGAISLCFICVFKDCFVCCYRERAANRRMAELRRLQRQSEEINLQQSIGNSYAASSGNVRLYPRRHQGDGHYPISVEV